MRKLAEPAVQHIPNLPTVSLTIGQFIAIFFLTLLCRSLFLFYYVVVYLKQASYYCYSYYVYMLLVYVCIKSLRHLETFSLLQ